MLWDISEDLTVVRNFWVDNTSLLKEGDMISGRNSLKYVVLVNLQLDFWAILIFIAAVLQSDLPLKGGPAVSP